MQALSRLSAFGGIGVYQLKKNQLYSFRYKSDENFEKCEHIDFNQTLNVGYMRHGL